MSAFWKMNFNDPWNFMGWREKMSFFSRIWSQDHNVRVLKWPAPSPDLNPIEHLWHYIKRMLNEYDEPARGVQELWERVQKQWDKIAKDVCQKLIEGMPRRVKAIYNAKGGYTKY